MKYGCCTSVENYYLIRKIGYDFIELSGREITAMSDEQFKRIADKASAGELRCNGFNDYCSSDVAIVGPSYNAKQAEQYAKLICERGYRLNISTIGIGAPMSRRLPEGFSKAEADRQVIEFLNITADIAKQYGITILFESLNDKVSNYVTFISEAVEIVKQVNKDNLKIVADFYHMWMMNEDVINIAYAFPYIYHLHIAQDRDGNRGYLCEDFYHKYKEAIAAVSKQGYNKTISVEAFWGDFEQGATQSFQILKRIGEELGL
ncbi:MAG: sugar phosphate isomerase/epimerase family protein [Clostridia bacterium]